MTATVWIVVGFVGLVSALMKGSGPVVFGSRELPHAFRRVVPYLATALLTALVVTETFTGRGRSLVVDARSAGLAVAAVAVACHRSALVAAIASAAVAALVRAVS